MSVWSRYEQIKGVGGDERGGVAAGHEDNVPAQHAVFGPSGTGFDPAHTVDHSGNVLYTDYIATCTTDPSDQVRRVEHTGYLLTLRESWRPGRFPMAGYR